MSKENNQRFTFITNVVGWEGQINATHISNKFQLSRQAASHILKEYRNVFPEALQYDASQKAYVATDDFNNNFATNGNFKSLSQYLTAIERTDNINESITSSIIEVEAPLRNINPLQIRPILRAIREQSQIDIGYISLSSPDYLDRIIQPHALIFDGLRWHVRAYCNKNSSFRDFTLSRFNGEATFEGKATHNAAEDERWNTIVDVVIEADSRLSDSQRRIIEQDFQMQQGQKTIPTRAALVNYLLRRLHLDSYKNTPEEQQIVLTKESRKAITPYLPKPV
ncbi:WYL domain-containing protein [Colwellia sp. 20A7]|uniref:WYL domain-containing protein n=1 Tax=Colwellia sp. 20A7 TaxID=2689569 RepID=UPI001357BC0F|nr:WYL domain-containing protein [Colwellia sp. 20A7]